MTLVHAIGFHVLAHMYKIASLEIFDRVNRLQGAKAKRPINAGAIERFPDAVKYFSKFAVELGLTDPEDANDQVISVNLVKGWLANVVKGLYPVNEISIQEADWLLIFDNVDNPEDLEEFWPLEKGSILITSWDPFAKANPYMVMSEIDLDPFSEEDAARFLMRLTTIGYKEIEHLPKGGLALGLTQMADLINRHDYTFREFLQRYDEKSIGRFHKFKENWQPNSYEHNIASVWALDRVRKGSLRLLEVISLLDPGGIKESMLTVAATEVDLDEFSKTKNQYEEARLELVRRSLVTRKKEALESSIHPLTQDAVRTQMNASRCRTTFTAAVVLLRSVWPFATMAQRHQISRWAQCESLLRNVIRLQDLYSSFILPQKMSISNPKFARLLVAAAWYLTNTAVAQVSAYSDVAQGVCESQNEDARLILSDIYYTGGAEAAETNDKRTAMQNNTAFLHLRLNISETSTFGTKDATLAQAYNQAANANLDQKRFKRALEYYDKALEVFQSLPDYCETMTSICVANLGTAYWLLGRLGDAHRLVIRNLRAREAKFGVDDTESFRTGRLLHVLGNVTASQGQLSESFRYHTRALAQYRATVGNKHHRTADLCFKVAQHELRFGHFSQARAYLDQALHIYTS
ncbi:hypothetical protein P154DRAFT_569485 [Amniculicola lignicola CBS 123094]|uniref:DUF7779 domain-containing protein n=1 Tax=Amniculicola lignicola CBS 123094 TaxID=1392246 RepID=A0A6A5X3X3_9PLEO|nr:hypothetical protein P154DRAFT_569485 [Amniculicola lignicola CBS 123094]